jgi:hypothetical protein
MIPRSKWIREQELLIRGREGGWWEHLFFIIILKLSDIL